MNAGQESEQSGPVPILGAPTASGKSSAAIELARKFPLEVVTADAMQVYRGMDIGTAKPTAAERQLVPHHLIDLVDPSESFSVADWVEHAEEVIAGIRRRGKTPLVVGGTGFYLSALARGLPTVPTADPQVQARLWQEFETGGLEPLLSELEAASPHDARRAQRNPRRVVRALEIVRRTGRAPYDFPFTAPRFTYSTAVLEPPMERLRPRIEERCRRMFEQGLAHEVAGLLARYPRQSTAMQAIGYKEIAQALANEKSLAEAQEEVLLATLRYARRQLTWFRKQRAQVRLPLLAHEALPQLEQWLAQSH